METAYMTSEATNINDYILKFNPGLPMVNNKIEDIAEMMDKAHTLFQNGELEEIGIRARKIVEKEFSWMKIAQQLIDIYTV